jgi:hypothetical protein
MTTHETQPETVDPTQRGDRVETSEPMREQPPAETPVTTEAADTPIEAESTRGSEPVESEVPTTNLEPREETVDSTESPGSGGQLLFADGELSGLRSRWTEVQSAFVDDPRDCVQKADGLVADVVEKLTAGFSQARSRLEEQWDRGEDVSTEDLRIALKRYRDFFERLLAV